MTTSPVSGSRALTLPPVHITKLFLGSSWCRSANSSRSFLSILLPRFIVGIPLPQSIHGSSFDDQSLFVTFHEHCKAIDIGWIGSYRRAIFPCKDLVREMGFQR